MNTTGVPERKRGGCLTVWLILVIIVNPLVALYYLLAGTLGGLSLSNLPGWYIALMIIFSALNVVSAIGIWGWKKWGAYVFAAVTLVGFIINVITIGFLSSLLGLVGLVILAALILPNWNQME